MGAKGKVPIIEGFFTWPSDDPRIIASRCKKCGTVTFPKRPFCVNPDCEKERGNVEEIELSKKGILYSYSYQLYQPPKPFGDDLFTNLCPKIAAGRKTFSCWIYTALTSMLFRASD